MTITRILVVGIEPTYTATLTFDGVDVVTASPGLPFKDALREVYPQTEGHPSQNTAFLLPGDDPRILTVANKIASKGHPVVLCVTGYDAPETDLSVVHVKRLHQSIIETLGVRPVPATTVIDDMLTDYDDQPEPSAGTNPEVFVVDYQDDDEPIHLAAPPTPPADTQPDVPVGIAPPPPTNPLTTQTPWGSPPPPAPAQPAAPTAPPWQPQQAPPPPAQPAPQPAAPPPAWQPTPVAAHHGPTTAATGPTIHQTTAPAYKETATIYAFAVPKGGTGKTGLSLMFANTLAEGLRRGLPEGAPGPRVVWIDGNPQQADGRYNIGVEPARTIMDLAATSFDESSIESYLTPPDPSVGRYLWVLAGPTSKLKADPSVVTPALYRRITETLAKRFDHVVVDTPEARLYDPQMAEYAVPITDWLIVPVTPDRGILDGTREWLDLIKAPKYARGYAFDMNRVRIILNMARKDIGYGSDEIAVEMSRWAFAGEVPYSVEWAKAKNLYCLPFNDPDLQRSLRAIIFAMTNAPIFRDDPKKKGFLAGIGLRRKSA